MLAVSALLAFMRGLVREVLGLGAWVGAIFAGVLGAAARCGRSSQHGWAPRPGSIRSAFAVVFLIALIVLLLISRWISALVRASPIGGLDRTLGLVFGLARGAALVIIAYIVAGMVIPVERWPDAVLRRPNRLTPVYRGCHVGWWSQLPNRLPPAVCSTRRRPDVTATAEALLHATPQGRAIGKPPHA